MSRILGGTRCGAEAPKAQSETPKASSGRGNGEGYPPPHPTRGLGSVVSSPAGSGVEPCIALDRHCQTVNKEQFKNNFNAAVANFNKKVCTLLSLSAQRVACET